MKNYSKLLLAAAFACNAIAASAIPAMRGVWRTLTLVDGTQVRAELRGDEYGSFWMAADGSCYTPMTDNSTFYVKTDLKKVLEVSDAKRQAANANRAKRMKAAGKPMRVGKPTGSFFGKKKGLIILVQYQDTKFGVGYNKKYVNGFVNGPLLASHTKRGFVGTVKDYFLNQSNGQFELDFDVVGPYTLKYDHAHYGQDNKSTGEKDVNRGSMILEAVKAADADVNFADYVWTDNGEVDQVYVLFAGHGQADGSANTTIWPHESALSQSEVGTPYTSNDVDANGNKVKVDTYACGPELLSTYRAGIGTLCHEFAHCLGYPDLYDTSYTNHFGMGNYDLMDAGSYNGNSFCPPNFSAYEKWFAGWINPIVLDKPATIKGLSAQDVAYGQAFLINNDAVDNEYYLIENRQNTVGVWDKEIPTSGMMITHVDYDENVWSFNNVNSCIKFSVEYSNPAYKKYDSDHERLTIICADNTRTAGSQKGDLYPYNGNNALTDTSEPAATVYNVKTHMGKPITNITQNIDGTIDFDFMGGSSDNVITAIETIALNGAKNDGKVYSVDGRYLGNDINAVGNGVFIQNGKKIVK